MKHTFTLIILALCFTASGQVSLFEHAPGQSEYVKESKIFALRSDRLQEIQDDRPETLSLQIDNIILQLDRAYIGDYVLRTNTGSTLQRNQNATFYRGSVSGQDNSLAAVSIIDDDVTIMFTAKGDVYRMHKSEGRYLLYKDNDKLERGPDMICFTDKDLYVPDPPHGAISLPGNCVEIYFEVDFKSYQDNGSSVSNTEAWVAALFNEVATLYDNEDIPVAISDIMVWTSTDPYASLSGMGAILDKFVDETDQNGYDGRLAHLLSTRNLGGGIAYVNVLCHTRLACGVSSSLSTNIVPFPNYSWNVTVVTHELGHNFGSRHTHDCVWNGNNTQIDDCGSQAGDVQSCYNSNNPILPVDGTIMSYCHLVGVGINFNLGFGPQPGALILNKFTNANCNTGVCSVLAIGVQEFEARIDNCIVHLRWIADSTAILSEGDGEHWQEIQVSGSAYTDYSPSKYYKLESDGQSKIITNYDLCITHFRVEGSTVIINTAGHYQVVTTDARTIHYGHLSEGSRIKLHTGTWVVVYENTYVEKVIIHK